MRDEIVQTSERYRQQVLRELQAHYRYDTLNRVWDAILTTSEIQIKQKKLNCREDLKLDDYAARIGELFMLIFNFDVRLYEKGASEAKAEGHTHAQKHTDFFLRKLNFAVSPVFFNEQQFFIYFWTIMRR